MCTLVTASTDSSVSLDKSSASCAIVIVTHRKKATPKAMRSSARNAEIFDMKQPNVLKLSELANRSVLAAKTMPKVWTLVMRVVLLTIKNAKSIFNANNHCSQGQQALTDQGWIRRAKVCLFANTSTSRLWKIFTVAKKSIEFKWTATAVFTWRLFNWLTTKLENEEKKIQIIDFDKIRWESLVIILHCSVFFKV